MGVLASAIVVTMLMFNTAAFATSKSGYPTAKKTVSAKLEKLHQQAAAELAKSGKAQTQKAESPKKSKFDMVAKYGNVAEVNGVPVHPRMTEQEAASYAAEMEKEMADYKQAMLDREKGGVSIKSRLTRRERPTKPATASVQNGKSMGKASQDVLPGKITGKTVVVAEANQVDITAVQQPLDSELDALTTHNTKTPQNVPQPVKK